MLPNNINEAALKQLAAGMMGGKLMNQRAELSSKYQQQYASWRFQLRWARPALRHPHPHPHLPGYTAALLHCSGLLHVLH
jgi:hypothetical protein